LLIFRVRQCPFSLNLCRSLRSWPPASFRLVRNCRWLCKCCVCGKRQKQRDCATLPNSSKCSKRNSYFSYEYLSSSRSWFCTKSYFYSFTPEFLGSAPPFPTHLDYYHNTFAYFTPMFITSRHRRENMNFHTNMIARCKASTNPNQNGNTVILCQGKMWEKNAKVKNPIIRTENRI